MSEKLFKLQSQYPGSVVPLAMFIVSDCMMMKIKIIAVVCVTNAMKCVDKCIRIATNTKLRKFIRTWFFIMFAVTKQKGENNKTNCKWTIGSLFDWFVKYVFCSRDYHKIRRYLKFSWHIQLTHLVDTFRTNLKKYTFGALMMMSCDKHNSPEFLLVFAVQN